jgi:hypothetical protein
MVFSSESPRTSRVTWRALQPADALARQRAHALGHLGRRRGDGEIVMRLHAHHARGLRRAVCAGEGRGERQRHLAEDAPGQAPAQRALDAVEALDHLDAT